MCRKYAKITNKNNITERKAFGVDFVANFVEGKNNTQIFITCRSEIWITVLFTGVL